MASNVTSMSCSEVGCSMSVSGEDCMELREIMEDHKYAKHSKMFYETILGRLPNEIWLKIIFYTISDIDKTRTILRQRELSTLGSVCKRMHELVSYAEFHRDIYLSTFCADINQPSAFERDEFGAIHKMTIDIFFLVQSFLLR